ncbi:Multi-copper polyphenol oxidoreductase, laccase [Thalassoporum mexicanum PCC 7367]|uniref:peptidoglycan editing factor PgeF n=1 Tax=Thalassoporum mexicanum TaxID=3457544 RepID=UPI00029F863E|nr:peptidoglycan editing factor PgeF [Pseudanabaena sp. PCC 7367]AFY71035.1 Multi-copper polyphenol oxidoreductase, laccase [Pseudanabaena sp. PCC 7367]
MNSNGWHWQNGYLTCDLLAPWAHGFFSKVHAPSMPIELQQHFYTPQNTPLNSDRDSQTKQTNQPLDGIAYRAKQVHGDRLLDNQELDQLAIGQVNSTLPEADGVFIQVALSQPEAENSNLAKKETKQSVWVCTADCVPVLIADRNLGHVAAVHAGWRGTAAGILTKAIAKFLNHGSQLEDLRIALGPAISGEVYQVTETVAAQVIATISTEVGIFPDQEPERCRLDLRAVQQQQLSEMGIAKPQMAIAPYCTLQTPDRFYSYRRYTKENPDHKGGAPRVQWSGIAIN